MSCLKETEIEKTALKKLKGEAISEIILNHLQKCAFCNEQFNKIVNLYSNSLELLVNPEFDFPDKLAQVYERHLFIAYPLGLKKVNVPESEHSLLAAENHTDEFIMQVVSLGSYATREGDILVRILKNISNDEVTLYLIADDETKYRNVLVNIPEIKGEFPSDDNGCVKLGKLSIPNPEELTVEIKTPLSTFSLASLSRTKEEILAQSEIVLYNDKNDSIKLEFIPQESKHTLIVQLLNISSIKKGARLKVLVSRRKNEPLLKSAKKGMAVFENMDGNGELRIQIFD